jgi:hypothetical protein
MEQDSSMKQAKYSIFKVSPTILPFARSLGCFSLTGMIFIFVMKRVKGHFETKNIKHAALH